MRRYLFMALAILLASCSKSGQENPQLPPPYDKNQPIRIAVSAEPFNSSKATFDADGAFSWCEGDRIGIFTDAYECASCSYRGIVDGKHIFETLPGDTPYLAAVHPCLDFGALSGKAVTFTLGDFSWKEGHVDSPMIAQITDAEQIYGENPHLYFRHTASVVRVHFDNVPVTASKLVFTADKRISGSFTIEDCTVKNSMLVTDMEEGNSITVSFPFRPYPNTGMTFDIPVPTGNYEYFQVRLKETVKTKDSSIDKTICGYQFTGPFELGRADLAVGDDITLAPKTLSVTGVDSPATDANIYDLGHKFTTNYGIQQFGIDKDGYIYYASVNGEKTRIDKVAPSTSKSGSTSVISSMDFTYSGHLTGMGIENASDGTYLWIPEYSDKSGSYYGMKTIGRVKFEAGANYAPDNAAIEHYYLPTNEKSTMLVSLDEEHDRLAVCFWESDHDGSKKDLFGRRIRIYSLSEAKALSLKSCELTDNIADGLSTTITAKNLSELTPLAEIGTPWGFDASSLNQINSLGFQGFDYYGGKVYFLEGTGNYNSSGQALGALTVFNCPDGYFPSDSAHPEFGDEDNAMLFESRSFISLLSDTAALSDFGITTSGYAEPEGVCVWKGNLYIGVQSRGFSGDASSVRRANVLKYSVPGQKGEGMTPRDLGDGSYLE